MKFFIFFLVGFLFGVGVMYLYFSSLIQTNVDSIVDQIIISTQNSLPKDLRNIPTDLSGNVRKDFIEKWYQDQKQDIQQTMTQKKQQIKQTITDSVKVFLLKKIDEIFGK